MKDYELVYKFEKGIMTDKERQQFIDDYIHEQLYVDYLLHGDDYLCRKEL